MKKKKLIKITAILILAFAIVVIAVFLVLHIIRERNAEIAIQHIKSNYGVECEYLDQSEITWKYGKGNPMEEITDEEIYSGNVITLSPVEAEENDYRCIGVFVTLEGEVISDDYYIMAAENRMSDFFSLGADNIWSEDIHINSKFTNELDVLSFLSAQPIIHERNLSFGVEAETIKWLKENLEGDIKTVKEKLPPCDINVRVDYKGAIDYEKESRRVLLFMKYLRDNKCVVSDINVDYYDGDKYMGEIKFSGLDNGNETKEENLKADA